MGVATFTVVLCGQVGTWFHIPGPEPDLDPVLVRNAYSARNPLTTGEISYKNLCNLHEDYNLRLKENSFFFFKPIPYFWHEIRLSTHREQFGESRRPSEDI